MFASDHSIGTGFSAGPLAVMAHPNSYRETNQSELQLPVSHVLPSGAVLQFPLSKNCFIIFPGGHQHLAYTTPDLLKRGIVCTNSSSMTTLSGKPPTLGKLEEHLCTNYGKMPRLNCVQQLFSVVIMRQFHFHGSVNIKLKQSVKKRRASQRQEVEWGGISCRKIEMV